MMLMLVVLALTAAEPAAAPAAADDPAADLAELQQMYDQSCAARAYGAYDDMCDGLSHQLKAARSDADRQARRKAAEARRHPRPPLTSSSGPAKAQVTAPPATSPGQPSIPQ